MGLLRSEVSTNAVVGNCEVFGGQELRSIRWSGTAAFRVRGSEFSNRSMRRIGLAHGPVVRNDLRLQLPKVRPRLNPEPSGSS